MNGFAALIVIGRLSAMDESQFDGSSLADIMLPLIKKKKKRTYAKLKKLLCLTQLQFEENILGFIPTSKKDAIRHIGDIYKLHNELMFPNNSPFGGDGSKNEPYIS